MYRIVAVAAVFLGLAGSARAQVPFDYYLLSLSVAPSFCAESARNAEKTECRQLTGEAFRQTPLTLHGLWPNRVRAGSDRQPQECGGPPLRLSRAMEADLQRYMPGGPGLTRYEWRKHGTCSGLDPDRYFAAAVALTRMANEVFGPAVAGGGTAALGDLQQRAAARDPALAAALIVDCRFARGGEAMLEEVRLTLDRAFKPIAAASVGKGQNSGCPGGVGRVPAVQR